MNNQHHKTIRFLQVFRLPRIHFIHTRFHFCFKIPKIQLYFKAIPHYVEMIELLRY